MPEYTKPEHRRFVEDMEAAGLEVRDYRGRNFYSDPAVAVDDIQDALSKTTVKCQWEEAAGILTQNAAQGLRKPRSLR